MNKFKLNELKKALEARDLRERAVLLVAVIAVIGYAWLTFAYDQLNAAKQGVQRQITAANAQIAAEANRYAQVQASYSQDPNSFARRRLGELQADSKEVDARLDQVYGQLIQPKEMSLVLTSILQRETTLKLVSLENLEPESLITTKVGATATNGQGLQVFKHGLRLQFEGSFLDTIRYLQSLEGLDSNFFWQDLSFEVMEYPKARITLNIFTLGSQRGWIGV